MKNLKLENAELDSQILPVKILPAELPVSLCPYVFTVDLLLRTASYLVKPTTAPFSVSKQTDGNFW